MRAAIAARGSSPRCTRLHCARSGWRSSRWPGARWRVRKASARGRPTTISRPCSKTSPSTSSTSAPRTQPMRPRCSRRSSAASTSSARNRSRSRPRRAGRCSKPRSSGGSCTRPAITPASIRSSSRCVSSVAGGELGEVCIRPRAVSLRRPALPRLRVADRPGSLGPAPTSSATSAPTGSTSRST